MNDPIGTVRRHFDMRAVKQADDQWLIVYPDSAPTMTDQRIEDKSDKWPVEYRPGDRVEELI